MNFLSKLIQYVPGGGPPPPGPDAPPGVGIDQYLYIMGLIIIIYTIVKIFKRRKI